jgi:hypothetical protein
LADEIPRLSRLYPEHSCKMSVLHNLTTLETIWVMIGQPQCSA